MTDPAPEAGERRVSVSVPVFSSDPELGPATWSVMTWTGSSWKPLGTRYATRSEAEASSAYRVGRRQREARWSRGGLTLHSPTWHLELGWFGPAVLAVGAAAAIRRLLAR